MNQKKYKITYLILHYQVIEETKKCVESLMENVISLYSDVDIVIVDNASPNNSGSRLKELYKNNKFIKVLLLDKNLGFAQGNNIGYKFAKNNGASFIVQMNNDMLIEDKLFNKKIVELYEVYKYGVLGPDIYCPLEDFHQNPAKGFAFTTTVVRKKILRAKILRMLNFLGLYEPIKKRIKYKPEYKDDEKILNYEKGEILHGSCLIFSPDYIRMFEGLNPETFMYYEENILAFRCMKNNLKMFFSSQIQVLHYRKVATKNITKDLKRRNEFFYEHSIHSLNVLLKLIKSYEN